MLETHLTHLETSGLLRRAQSEPELEYLFRHALIQEAAYTSLLKADRRTLHRAVGETLERTYPDRLDELAFMLGQHYRVAGEVDRARECFIRAGNFARQQYANAEATAAYTEALALTAISSERFEMLAARAAVYDVTAMRVEQRADIDAMLSLAQELNDDARLCDGLLALSKFYLRTEFLQARAPAEQALGLARKLGDAIREGHALRDLGENAFDRREFSESRTLLETAAACFRQAHQPGEVAVCLNWLALTLSELNELSAAQQAVEEAVQLSRLAGDRRQEAINLRRLATVYTNQNRHAAALPFAEAALEVNRQLGDRANESYTLNVLGIVYSALGERERGQAYYHAALDLAESIQLQFGIRITVNNLVELYQSGGAYQAGIEFLEGQIAKAVQSHDEYLQTEHRAMQAHLYAQVGQFARALGLWQTALERRQKAGRFIEGALANISRMQALLGRAAEARQGMAQVFEYAAQRAGLFTQGLSLADAAFVSYWAGEAEAQRAGLAQAEQALELLAQNLNQVPVINTRALAARLHLAVGEAARALAHSTEAVRLLEANPDLWEMEGVLYAHALALRAAGRAVEADEYLHKAYDRVMLVASKTSDPELRRSWLENVRDNREIISEWESRHADKLTR